MKGAFNLAYSVIVVVIVTAVLIGLLYFAYNYDIYGAMTGNARDYEEVEALGYFSHIVIVPTDEGTFNLIEAKEQIDYPPEGDKEDCYDCISCTGCEDTQEFAQSQMCTECLDCDEYTGECSFCGICETGKSDYSSDGNLYEDCDSCFDCIDCIVDDGDADICSSCESCMTCENKKQTYKTYESCAYCSSQLDGQNPTGCAVCYNGADKTESKNFNKCDECQSCDQGCEDQEPKICESIKRCIKNYDGTPCNTFDSAVFYDLTISDATSDTDISTLIKNALSRCKSEAVNKPVSENGKQFVCNFDSTKIIDQKIRLDKNAVFTNCGDTESSLNTIYSNTFSFAQNKGMNYRVSVGSVDYGSNPDNICSFNLFVCGQPALYVGEIDTMNDYYDDPSIGLYANLFLIDEDDFKEYIYAENGKNERGGVSFNYDINFAGNSMTAEEISDVIVAGLRDWSVLNQDNQLIKQKVIELAQVSSGGTEYWEEWNLCDDHMIDLTDAEISNIETLLGDECKNIGIDEVLPYVNKVKILENSESAPVHAPALIDYYGWKNFKIEDDNKDTNCIESSHIWSLYNYQETTCPSNDGCDEQEFNIVYPWVIDPPFDSLNEEDTNTLNPDIVSLSFEFEQWDDDSENKGKTDVKAKFGDDDPQKLTSSMNDKSLPCGQTSTSLEWDEVDTSYVPKNPSTWLNDFSKVFIDNDECKFNSTNLCTKYDLPLSNNVKCYYDNAKLIYSYEKDGDDIFDKGVKIGVRLIPDIIFEGPYEATLILIPTVSFIEVGD